MLKAGLVSKGKVKQQKQNSRKKRRRTPGDKPSDEAAKQAAAAQRANRERDRQLNLEREQVKQRKALRVQMRQLLRTHRVNDKKAEDRYNFTMGDKLKSLYVTPKQRSELMSARLAIVLHGDSQYLVPVEVVDKARALEADLQVYIVPATTEKDSAAEADADDPYADYQVPDDLMW